jgi:hypothetical protein
MLLPDSVVLKIQVPQTSRHSAYASFDGRNRIELKRMDSITIELVWIGSLIFRVHGLYLLFVARARQGTGSRGMDV